MWTVETVAVVALTFLMAGFVKGVVGLGLPTIALAALTATLGLQPAMALVLAPSFATNLLQATSGGHGSAVVRRLWPYFAAAAGGIWLGVQIFIASDTALLSKLLGVMIVIYSLLSLSRLRPNYKHFLPGDGRRDPNLFTRKDAGVEGSISRR